jgi:parallel beta-helix repeat protein
VQVFKCSNIEKLIIFMSKTKLCLNLAVTLAVFALISLPKSAISQQQLPLPPVLLPENPPFPPAIIFNDLIRSPLPQDSKLIWSANLQRFASNHVGAWLINHPSVPKAFIAEVMEMPHLKVRNWYWRGNDETSLLPRQNPAVSYGNSAVGSPTIIVNNGAAVSGNAGSKRQIKYVKSISEAIEFAEPGEVIHVYPGVYRETIDVSRSGSENLPIRIIGIANSDGEKPLISGNFPIVAEKWKKFEGVGLSNVFEASIAGYYPGVVITGRTTLVEKDGVNQLDRPNSYAFSWGAPALRSAKSVNQLSAEFSDAKFREIITAEEDGWLNLYSGFGSVPHQSILIGRTYIYSHELQQIRLIIDGDFRSSRLLGMKSNSRFNRYRLWINGTAISPLIYSDRVHNEFLKPHISFGAQPGEQTVNAELRTGWNEIFFQFDTTTAPEKSKLLVKFAPSAKKSLVEINPTAEIPSKLENVLFLSKMHIALAANASAETKLFVRTEDGKSPDTALFEVPSLTGPLVNIKGSFIEFSGFDLIGGTQTGQQPALLVSGQGSVISRNRFLHPDGRAITVNAVGIQKNSPIIVRQNWINNPGHIGIGASGEAAGSKSNLFSESLSASSMNRGRYVIEDNVILNSNRSGFPVFWESGCIKVVRSSGSIIRGNACLGNNGVGIWLDWENFSNRVEGNYIVNAWGCGICVEASPGPNLIANNLVVGTYPGPAWMSGGILAWDGARTWAVNNTIDAMYADVRIGSLKHGIGLNLTGNAALRDSRFKNAIAANAEQESVQNAIFGSYGELKSNGNVKSVDNIVQADGLYNPSKTFNELPFLYSGNRDRLSSNKSSVTHDISGLLRALGEQTIGAFRLPSADEKTSKAVLEVEFEDGTVMKKIFK